MSVLILLFLKSVLVLNSNSMIICVSKHDPQYEKMKNVSLPELLVSKSEETVNVPRTLSNLAAV